MTTAVARQQRGIARPVKVLIPLIQADLEHGDRAGMQYYADAGEKLIEVKESGQVGHGNWARWVSKNFALSDRTASTYMRYARLRAEKGSSGSDLPRSLSEMRGKTQHQREHRHAERAFREVLREVETDVYAQEKQTRVDEVALHREMALELIDVGFKALATRLHPDRGGSKEAMSRLNRVRDELKGVAERKRFL